MNNKRNWTLKTTDDGEKIFVDTVTGEFVKGYDVHLYSNVKTLSRRVAVSDFIIA
ncbi:MAG: hypothetical protein IIT39_17420 [Clostridia bacterium]|nr:hypothetical protein [Clostridia bacterium]